MPPMNLYSYIAKGHATYTALAVGLGVHRTRILRYASGEDIIPAERVLKLEELTGRKVRRWEMRPDIYPPPKGKG